MRGMAPCVFFSIPAFHPKGKGARRLRGYAVPAAGGGRPGCAARALWFGKLKQCPRGEKAGSALQGRAPAQGRLCRKHAAAAFFSQPYCSMQFASPGGAKRPCLASDAKDRKNHGGPEGCHGELRCMMRRAPLSKPFACLRGPACGRYFMAPDDIYAAWPFRRADGVPLCLCAARAELLCIRLCSAAPDGR